MERNRQCILVDAPELGEDRFSLRACVDEDERHLRSLDALVDLGDRMARAVPGPWQPLARVEHVNVGRSARRRQDEFRHGGHRLALRRCKRRRLRHQPAAQLIGIAHGGRQADHRELRRNGAQAREAKRQQVAALRGDNGMQFVEHDAT